MISTLHQRVVFTRPHRWCCICSANYYNYFLISLLVWLDDVKALLLVMWPLSWYKFSVSLPRPLEVSIVGIGLFLQALCLLSVVHCLPPIIGGSCHKYHFCNDKILSPQNTSFVATEVCLPRQNVFIFCVCLEFDVMLYCVWSLIYCCTVFGVWCDDVQCLESDVIMYYVWSRI